VAVVGAILTLAQGRRERNRWRPEIKMTYATEVHKARMQSYPEVFRVLASLSSLRFNLLTAEAAGRIADELNAWIYSTGGMCADATTRGAIIALRQRCAQWEKSGDCPPDLFAFRTLAVAFLRRDIDVSGLESYDFDQDSTLLDRLQNELVAMEQADHKKDTQRANWRNFSEFRNFKGL
jgi:hypothetical protein